MLKFAGLALLLGLPVAVQAQQLTPEQATAWTGTWFWDRNLFIQPRNWPEMSQQVSETMTVSRDDGERFVANVEIHWANGAVTFNHWDIPEDGEYHTIHGQYGSWESSVSVTPGNGRHVKSNANGAILDNECTLSPDEMTHTCNGIYTTPDGVKGTNRCVHHRDPHTIRVTARRPRSKFT